MSEIKKDIKDLSTQNSENNFRAVFSHSLKNDHHTFVVQKAGKLASALYLVTGFMTPEEPLKTRLRTCALDLVSSATDPAKAREKDAQGGFSSRCLEIGTILKLAERAGLVSGMNAQILCDEYANLSSFVKDHYERIFDGGALDVGDRKWPVSRSQGPNVPYSIGHSSVKDGSVSVRFKKTNNDKRHNLRRENILKLFDKKDKITIKDASAAVIGCSEKTVQRELIALVQEGVLVREGERRWSTYKKA